MIEISQRSTVDGTRRVRFAVADTGVPLSVVGDWNDWDPYSHPLRRRSNGTRSVIVHLPSGTAYRFRYLADGGRFLDDPDMERSEPNGYGEQHGILTV